MIKKPEVEKQKDPGPEKEIQQEPPEPQPEKREDPFSRQTPEKEIDPLPDSVPEKQIEPNIPEEERNNPGNNPIEATGLTNPVSEPS